MLGAGAAWYLDLISWWMIFVVLLVFGAMWAVYEKWKEADDQRQELEEKTATAAKRKTVKDLLGDAVDEGKNLQRTVYADGGELKLVSQQDVEDWVHRTYDLIEAAFDRGEAQHFLNSEDYKPEKASPFRDARHDPYKYFTEIRLRRLNELIVRANLLEISPDFDPQSVAREAKAYTAERIRLATAVERKTAQNETLKAEIEQVTAERDAFELESRKLGGRKRRASKGTLPGAISRTL